jgi:hypothetical protein
MLHRLHPAYRSRPADEVDDRYGGQTRRDREREAARPMPLPSVDDVRRMLLGRPAQALVIRTITRAYTVRSSAEVAVSPSDKCLIIFTADGVGHRVRWHRLVEVRPVAPADDDD